MNTEATRKDRTIREGEAAGVLRAVLKEDTAGPASPWSPVWLPMASKGWPVDDFSEGKFPLDLISGGDGLLFSFRTEGS